MFGSIAKNGAVPVTIEGGGPGLGGGGATGGSTSGGGMGGALKRVGKAYKGGGVKGAAKSLGRMGKGLLKGGGKGLLRTIPAAGALLSAGLEFADGGFTMENVGRAALSGGLGFLGGAAGTALLPGAGTIGGTVGGSMLGDYLGDAIFGEKPEPPAEDFIYRPGQKAMKFRKDDVVVGGTSLGGGGNTEVIALLKELITTVKSGGDVYLDGTKVGTAMAMGTYKTQ